LRPILEAIVVGDDIVADLDALVTDEYSRTGNKLAHIALVLVAKRATQDFGIPVFLGHAPPV
jgi:hypothetical protein